MYRLYHQALVDHLLEGRDQSADQRAITETLRTQVPVRTGGWPDWATAPPYTRTHLATHAARAGRVDTLLTDPGFLLAASRPQLLASLDAADSAPGRAAADAYRRAAHHLRAKPVREHASYLQLAARCGRAPELADALDAHGLPGMWSARWASWRYQPPHQTLTGHTEWVSAVAVAELDGRPVVISGSGDRTVRVWDLATGTPLSRPFTGHTDWVRAVAVAKLDNRPVAISGSTDGTVRMWDLVKRQPVRGIVRAVRLRHSAPVLTTVVHRHHDHLYAITGCSDGTRWIWDLSTRRTLSTIPATNGAAVNAIALLGPTHVVSAAGSILTISPTNQNSVDSLTIDLESEVLALATASGSTVVAATTLGLVVLDIPRW